LKNIYKGSNKRAEDKNETGIKKTESTAKEDAADTAYDLRYTSGCICNWCCILQQTLLFPGDCIWNKNDEYKRGAA
jgi:hypothetical protein